MTPPRQVLARRHETSPSDVRDTGRSTRLPTELLTEQAARLTVFTTVAAVLWSFVLLLDLVLLPALSDSWIRNWRIIPIEVVGAVGIRASCGGTCAVGTSIEHKSTLGLAMMIMNAALIAGANAWAMPLPPDAPEIGRPSWIALLILIFAMIAPGVPRQMLVASLVAASLRPAGASHRVADWADGPRPRAACSSSAGRAMRARSSSSSPRRCSIASAAD